LPEESQKQKSQAKGVRIQSDQVRSKKKERKEENYFRRKKIISTTK